MNFTIKTELKYDVQIIRLIGNLDNVTAHFLFELFMRATAVPSPKIILNLAHVTNMLIDVDEIYPLSVILWGLVRARKKSGDLILCNLPPWIEDDMTLTHMNEAIGVYKDEQTALIAWLNGLPTVETSI